MLQSRVSALVIMLVDVCSCRAIDVVLEMALATPDLFYPNTPGQINPSIDPFTAASTHLH